MSDRVGQDPDMTSTDLDIQRSGDIDQPDLMDSWGDPGWSSLSRIVNPDGNAHTGIITSMNAMAIGLYPMAMCIHVSSDAHPT